MNTKKRIITTVIGIFLLSIVCCGIFIGLRQSQAVDDKPAEKPIIAVETVKAAPGEIKESIEVVGTLSSKFQADVKAEYPGIVREIYVSEWVHVKKGDKLLIQDDREPKALVNKAEAAVEMAKANLLQAKVGSQRAIREYNRLLKLKESGLATQQSLDEAGTEQEAAAARQKVAQAQLNAAEQEFHQAQVRYSKIVVTSPIDGAISSRAINVGDLTSDKTMFKIIDNRLLELTVTVPSKHMRNLQQGQAVLFTTDAFPGQVFKGKLMYINPVVNETDRSVKVVAEVPNEPEVLKGGLFVEGRIIIGQRSEALQTPRNALLTWDVTNQQAELFVVKNEIVERRSVKTGILSGDMVEITSGISAGDEVIVRGGFNVKEGDKVKITGNK